MILEDRFIRPLRPPVLEPIGVMQFESSRSDGLSGRATSLLTRKSVAQSEAEVSHFFEEYQDDSRGAASYLLRHPRRVLSVVANMARLPRLSVAVRPTADGKEILRAILDRHPLRRAFPHAAVLVLPREPGMYAFGPSKQTLRRKVRKAKALGITWRRIDDPAEREKLAQIAEDWERINPHEQYRNPHPMVSGLQVHPLWLAAFSADGRPLLLSVTPVDGRWALLRFFKSIEAGTEQSLARYYMTEVLVEHLVRANVRYLFDVTSPLRLPNGLRHFQRMIGYRIYRLRIDRSERRAEPARALQAQTYTRT